MESVETHSSFASGAFDINVSFIVEIALIVLKLKLYEKNPNTQVGKNGEKQRNAYSRVVNVVFLANASLNFVMTHMLL
jgi:hypothetical protein